MIGAGTRHFTWSENGAVIQLSAAGPLTVNYVNEEENPHAEFEEQSTV